MTASRSPPSPVPAKRTLRERWSRDTASCPRGLALAREKGWLLVWDKADWLYLFNHAGERQAQTRSPAPLSAACCAEDGSCYAAVGQQGEVWWLAPDLTPRWCRAVPQRAVTAALSSFGQYLAVSDTQGNLSVFDRRGRSVFQNVNPRPLQYLTFIPEAARLLGSANFGLVVCYDLNGRCAWRDGPVVHVGSLAASGDGSRILLACFSDGLRGYALTGKKLDRVPVSEPCRLAALTYDGRCALVAGLGEQLFLLDHKGHPLCSHVLDKPPVALALSALGDQAVVAQADGRVLNFSLGEILYPSRSPPG